MKGMFSMIIRKKKVMLYVVFMSQQKQEKLKVKYASAGRHIVTEIVSKKYSLPATELDMSENKYGKPYFISYPEIVFNISDDDQLIACGICNTNRQISFGIDIMSIDRKISEKVMNRFYHENEIKFVNAALSEDERNLRALEIWTRKESYGKCHGTGIDLKMQNVDTTQESRKKRFKTKIDQELRYILTVYSNKQIRIKCNEFVIS